ncbi:rab-GTPase-TBC domain-containing protein, partial [Vararia minispora EC-137]
LFREAYSRLYHSGHSLVKLKDAALGGRLFEDLQGPKGIAGRSMAWKIFLIPSGPLAPPEGLPPQLHVYVESLRASRAQFTTQLLEKMRAPDGSYEEGFTVPGTDVPPSRADNRANNLERDNPLSLHDENPWNTWFSSVDLRKTISQDVERTFPDIAYFRSSTVQEQLTNILFLHSVMHPRVGYRQGMHELLASLYYAVDFDSLQDPISDIDEELRELCTRRWVAADAWALFDSIMRSAGKWYEWREEQQPSSEPLGKLSEPYVAPILQACNRVQRDLLKRVDPELATSLERAGIEPQIYGIRWLRLLFTREFSMQDSMFIWDGLFAVDPSLDLAPWICVAMLIRIRNRLIPSDYSAQLTYLLRYPTPPVSTSIHHATLLLHHALTLQMSPTPSTGATITIENRNILNIPVEVPDPPPPPVRRSSRPGEAQRRRQTMYDDASVPEAGPSHRPGSFGRVTGNQLGLPEMIARNLLDRGEALGINKTIYNAVTEIRRSLPDLAANLGVRTPPASSLGAAYPLIDERPVEERPPWEPRTRFEIERDMSRMQATHRKLGESVGWVVDTLLLDEGTDTARAQRVQSQKREALEVLSYVRDILLGSVLDEDIEEERLLGEDEFRARKERREKEARERIERE